MTDSDSLERVHTVPLLHVSNITNAERCLKTVKVLWNFISSRYNQSLSFPLLPVTPYSFPRLYFPPGFSTPTCPQLKLNL